MYMKERALHLRSLCLLTVFQPVYKLKLIIVCTYS